jgi:osmotically inducible protein OsmC
MKNLYVAKVHVTSGRDGTATSADGQLALRLGFPKELGGAGDAANPEQLFAAGYAACFASSVKAVAGKLSVPVSEVSVDAEATLSLRDDGSYVVSRVVLRVHGLHERADEVLAEAERLCAYTNTTRGNTAVDVAQA